MYAENICQFPDHRVVSRYRAPRACLLVAGDQHIPANLRSVSAMGAFVETDEPFALDEILVLEHPEAGQIRTKVIRVAVDGIALGFTFGDQAATFALSAISSDMTARSEVDIASR